FEYKYNDSYRSCNDNGCAYNQTMREASGTFVLDSKVSESEATAVDVGKVLIQQDGGTENPTCHAQTHTTLKGTLVVRPARGGPPKSALLPLDIGGENLHGETDASNCAGAHAYSSWDSGGFSVSCTVKNVDAVNGGIWSSYVDSDRGHGTCMIEVRRK